MNCNNENTLTRTNCRCENCTPIFDDSVNTNDCKLTPIFIDKLYNCTSQLYYEYNAPSVFVFGVASSKYTYPNNGKVKIDKISISYDDIGLPLSATNSIEVYFDGKLM